MLNSSLLFLKAWPHVFNYSRLILGFFNVKTDEFSSGEKEKIRSLKTTAVKPPHEIPRFNPDLQLFMYPIIFSLFLLFDI